MPNRKKPASRDRRRDAEPETEFAKRFSALVKGKGLSPKDVSERSGLHLSLVYYYMSGKRLPTTLSIFRLAKAIGATPADVISLVDEGDFDHETTAFRKKRR